MFSAMIVARMAQGRSVTDAIAIAKEHVTKALSAARAHSYHGGQMPTSAPPTAPTTERTVPTQPTERRDVPAHAAEPDEEPSAGLHAVGDARYRAGSAA